MHVPFYVWSIIAIAALAVAYLAGVRHSAQTKKAEQDLLQSAKAAGGKVEDFAGSITKRL